MTSEEKPKTRARERHKGAREQVAPDQEAPPAEPARLPDESSWHERAAFQVAFDQMSEDDGQTIWRTHAYHEEADDRAEWPGVAGAELLEWMRERAGLPGIAAAAERDNELLLALGPLDVEEISAERQAGGAAPAKRIRARFTFQFADPQADLIPASQSRCVVQVLACDAAAAGMTMLATLPLVLRTDQLDYTAATDFDLPGIGYYQLLGMVLIPDYTAVGITLGPLLTVTP